MCDGAKSPSQSKATALLAIKSTCLTLLSVTFLSHGAASTEPWQQVRTKNGIQVFEKRHSSGFNSFKANMTTTGCISRFQSVLHDTANVDKWVSNVNHVEVLAQLNADENYVYTQFDAPWPVKNRDMVTYSKSELINSNNLLITIRSAPYFKPENNQYIRIKNLTANWSVVNIGDQRIEVTYQVHAEPGGDLPRWLVNNMTRSNMYTTFKKLRDYLPINECE